MLRHLWAWFSRRLRHTGPARPYRISAGDSAFEARTQMLSEQVRARIRCHSIELPDGNVLPGLQSTDHLRWRLGIFGLPEDLRGKRVLDIGAWDGWFSFECERRGADVVAVDCVALDTFLEAKQLLGSKVEYFTLDVNELSATNLGRFDIVLFFGVLYHLRHPLLGLERLVELCTDFALVESFVISSESRAIPAVMEYYEHGELGGQIDNWCGPTPECLVSFCRSAGFVDTQLLDVTNNRASVICRRRWPEPPAHPAPAPELRSAVNNRSWEPRFHPQKDEYLCCFFRSPDTTLLRGNVFIEVDGFGTQALVVTPDGSGGWQANCLRPPGLEPGIHEVRIRTAASARSNTVTFTMLDERGWDGAVSGEQLPPISVELSRAEVQGSGDLRLAGSRGGALVCFFRAKASAIAPGQVTIECERERFKVASISSLGPGVWQANVNLNSPVREGALVRLRVGCGAWSKGRVVVNSAQPCGAGYAHEFPPRG
jgi:2-polyprenyl-3-methyl-5-hydroxy-6-metoxy-1,4-benzoquinol methylase